MCYNRTRKQDREGAIGMHITDRLLLLLVTVFTEALFTLVRRNLMSFTFFTAWHLLNYLLVFIQSLLGQGCKILVLRLDGDF